VTQLTNDALYEQLGSDGYAVGDDIFIFAGAPIVQAGAVAAAGPADQPDAGRIGRLAMRDLATFLLAAPPFCTRQYSSVSGTDRRRPYGASQPSYICTRSLVPATTIKGTGRAGRQSSR